MCVLLLLWFTEGRSIFLSNREDDNDKSDSDDEPVAFSLNHREKELRNMQNTILAAQEGKLSSEMCDSFAQRFKCWDTHRQFPCALLLVSLFDL